MAAGSRFHSSSVPEVPTSAIAYRWTSTTEPVDSSFIGVNWERTPKSTQAKERSTGYHSFNQAPHMITVEASEHSRWCQRRR